MIRNWNGRYSLAAGGVLIAAPSRRPFTVGIALAGAGGYTLEISATPADLIDGATGSGGYWETLDAGAASDHVVCDYAVTAIRVTVTDTAATVDLMS